MESKDSKSKGEKPRRQDWHLYRQMHVKDMPTCINCRSGWVRAKCNICQQFGPPLTKCASQCKGSYIKCGFCGWVKTPEEKKEASKCYLCSQETHNCPVYKF